MHWTRIFRDWTRIHMALRMPGGEWVENGDCLVPPGSASGCQPFLLPLPEWREYCTCLRAPEHASSETIKATWWEKDWDSCASNQPQCQALPTFLQGAKRLQKKTRGRTSWSSGLESHEIPNLLTMTFCPSCFWEIPEGYFLVASKPVCKL